MPAFFACRCQEQQTKSKAYFTTLFSFTRKKNKINQPAYKGVQNQTASFNKTKPVVCSIISSGNFGQKPKSMNSSSYKNCWHSLEVKQCSHNQLKKQQVFYRVKKLSAKRKRKTCLQPKIYRHLCTVKPVK